MRPLLHLLCNMLVDIYNLVRCLHYNENRLDILRIILPNEKYN